MTICIYHGNCADGFGAAWVVRKALGDIQERKIFWPAEVDFAVEALDSYEAACKEGT